MSRHCLAVGPYPVSMRRIPEWHHQLVAAVDAGLTAALTRRLILFTLPPLERGPSCEALKPRHGSSGLVRDDLVLTFGELEERANRVAG
jgi:hypothetical protein